MKLSRVFHVSHGNESCAFFVISGRSHRFAGSNARRRMGDGMMRCLKYGAQGRGSFSRRLSRAAAAQNGQGRRPSLRRSHWRPMVALPYGVWSVCGRGHACMPLWNADGEFANGESVRTDGRKAAFAIGSRVASSFPLCCPTNLGLPDIALGSKFETSVDKPHARPSTR